MNIQRCTKLLLVIFFPVTLLSACAGYQTQTKATMGAMQAGSVDFAIADLEKNNSSENKDILYYLEKGELLRMKGSYELSRDQWLVADARVREWEDQAKTNPAKLLGNIGSVLVNDTTRTYEGRDFEKVFVNVNLALDHIAIGTWDDARVEIKKMHEREAIIADFRSKELESAKSTASSKGLKVTQFKELNGYPVETLTDPAVIRLKNSYESAFANYLAGFVYEALGEVSLAAPGYRKAAEMVPNNPIVDDGLSGLEARVKTRTPKMVDTLFVIESGSAPSIVTQVLPIILPIPGQYGMTLVATPISWPVIRAADSSMVPGNVTVNNKIVPLALLTSVDVMARRALADEMPGIIVRSSVRAITKGVAQKAVDKTTANLGMAGLFVSLATKVVSISSEVADERGWRTLPGFYSVGRVKLPEGTNTVTIQTPAGVKTLDFQVSGKYAVISLRTTGSSLYLAQSPFINSPDVAIAEPEPVIKPVVAPVKPKKVVAANKPKQKPADAVNTQQ